MNPAPSRFFSARLLSGLFVLATMVMIFCFSAQDGDSSHEVSATLLASVIRWLRPAAEKLCGHALADESLEYILRKIGHFSEYALLGCSLYLFLRSWLRRPFVWAWLIAALYACTDELHQLFIAGRSPMPTDVLIDASGALCGILFLYLILRLIRHHRKAPQQEVPPC